ncbi:MAG: hypothetical protein HC918_05290 [Oscillatoriales cyanobacterium SM2_1_8]|nr:hypothetical protein [Oscillatoriales cyanobacterium SM2_1_8]
MTALQNSDSLGIWQVVDTAEASARTGEVAPQRFQTYGFNAATFQNLAARTVNEQGQVLDARTAGELIFLPTPDGTFSRFRIVESSVMAPELAAKFPDIKTYRGQGIDDPTATVRLSFTPSGFQGQVFSEAGAYYIDPRGDNYIAYYKRDLAAPPSSGPRTTDAVDLSRRLASDGSSFAARVGCTCLLCSAGQIVDLSERAVVLAMGASMVGPYGPQLAARTASTATSLTNSTDGFTADGFIAASLPLEGSNTAAPELAARSGTQLRTYRTAIAPVRNIRHFMGAQLPVVWRLWLR